MIRVVRHGDRSSIEVDGVVLPFFTSTEGCRVDVRRGHLPGVTLTLVARRVEVVDDWRSSAVDESDPSVS